MNQKTPFSPPEKPVLVVKLGGELIKSQQELKRLFALIADYQHQYRFVLVHGGGTQLDTWMEALSVPIEKINGLRVTTDKGIEVSTAVLAGLVNHQLVSLACAEGLVTVGMSLCDLKMFVCTTEEESPLGLVGSPQTQSAQYIDYLLAGEIIPIVSSIGHDQQFRLVNVNADDAAAALVELLSAEALYFLTSVSGVLDAGKQIIPSINLEECDVLIQAGVVVGGMAVKLAAAKKIIDEQGCDVIISDISNFCKKLNADSETSCTVIQKVSND